MTETDIDPAPSPDRSYAERVRNRTCDTCELEQPIPRGTRGIPCLTCAPLCHSHWKLKEPDMTETPDTPKLCKDCHWCDSNYEHARQWTCHKGSDGKIDPVTGMMGWSSETGVVTECYALRGLLLDHPEDAGLCNIDGRHWKAKEPPAPPRDNRPVGALGLGARIENCCEYAGIKTVADLAAATDVELLRMRNFGEVSLHDVRDKLAAQDREAAP